MTARKDRPGYETETIEVLAGGLSFDSSVAAPSDIAPLDPLYEATLTGWLIGRHSRDAEIRYLDRECSRYYYEFCRRQSRPLWDPNSPSFDELEERRGHPENAARVRRFMADLFAGVTS